MPHYLFYTDYKSGVRECREMTLQDADTAGHEGIKYAGTMASTDPQKLLKEGELRVDVTDGSDLLLFTIITLVVEAPASRRS